MAGYTVSVQVRWKFEREGNGWSAVARAEADEPRRRGHSVEGIESLKRVRRAEERAYGPYTTTIPVVVYVRDCVTNKRSLGTNRICIRTHNAFEAYLAPMCFVSFFFFSLSLFSFFSRVPAKIKEEGSSIRRGKKRGFGRSARTIRESETTNRFDARRFSLSLLSFPPRNRNNAGQ